ncbi:MAG: glutamate-1-semialdehyde 2,1-aminomutase [Candidatus Binatia bacterium]
MKRSEKLFAEARRIIPGGVNSPVRAWKSVGGCPRFISRGQGARITDVDGRSYVDMVCSWGPLIFGHAHPSVVRAVQEAASRGVSFGAPTPGEVELAREITGVYPSIEKVRLVSSGTEAAMSAIRVARAFTGKPGIVKFAGCYHGHVDALLVRAGSGAATFGTPDSEGVPEAFVALTRVAQFNDLGEVEGFLRSYGREIGAVIVEPVVGNMGVVLPRAGFLEGLRELTRRTGTLLIFDEVITGFRLAKGGVQELTGIAADLTCLGKILGGGLPVAAFGGRSEIMDKLSPIGGAYQAGTLSGNPLAVAAGLATLRDLGPKSYVRLEALGARLEEKIRRVLRDRRVQAVLNRAGSMWTIFFGVERVRNFAEASAADTQSYARFFHGMLERGFYLPPSQFEAAFLSLAHGEAEVDGAADAAAEALGSR